MLVTLTMGAPALSQSQTAAKPENSAMANAASPFLQLHSGDLVNWNEWGEAAFEKARKSNKLLLVSFGYTACHWCHVMQRLHFNNPKMAKFINDNFIPVMVDRERRPTLDDTYMVVTETLTQRGGWPNTVFMTPDHKPIYGTAYVPPEPFQQIMSVVADEWANNRPAVQVEAEKLSTLLNRYLTRTAKAAKITPEVLATTATELISNFDEFNGGYGDAPKFFRQPILMYLLQYFEKTGDKAALNAVTMTLDAIASGGIHDQIAGGFHRYAIDPQWRVPHFEKMLYDQAQLVEAYLKTYRLTGDKYYAGIARKTLDYVLKDLTAPSGGFYATRDADSLNARGEEEEGAFYVWTPEELTSILGKEEAEFAIAEYGVVADGDFVGKIILNRDLTGRKVEPRLDAIEAKLGEFRNSRAQPRRDEKTVVNWSSLMISAFANAATTLGDNAYKQAAINAGEFIWNNLRVAPGSLKRSYFDNAPHIDAELEDYALLSNAYIELFDLSSDQKWLSRASELSLEMEKKFGDTAQGDYYASADATGFVRTKPRSDGDMPSGNAMVLSMLSKLVRRLDETTIERKTEALVAALSGHIVGNAEGGASALSAADIFLNGQAGTIQYSEFGRVKAQARLASNGKSFSVQLQIADGWHVNANKPLEDNFIPTVLQVSGGKGIVINYPKPAIKTLGFNSKPMALHEGQMSISTTLPGSKVSAGKPVQSSLQIQVCNDQICLLPETLKFTVAPLPG